jgi:FkbH-like protein
VAGTRGPVELEFMRLSEALRINQQSVLPNAHTRKIQLVCGFTPLHLQTFVTAYAKRRFSGDEVTITTGLFGDLEGNLKRAREQSAEGAIVVLEWSDLDERLGFRAASGWSSEILSDILQQVGGKIHRLKQLVSDLAGEMPTALITGTLPLPPLTYLPVAQTSSFDLQLRCNLIGLVSQLVANTGVRLVNDASLAQSSPFSDRHDVKMELHAGFPYSIAHAAAVGELAMDCLFPAVPKKGLISDLDETLWKGILGDVGVNGVSWCLESHSQAHALYQQLLGSLAESGVLIAIASKNDPELVRSAFQRSDILLDAAQVFPVESNWGAKSESVGRILKAWNISADSVVFVDDSPMELAEVAEQNPGIECFRFPSDDPAGVIGLLKQLRARFGKGEIREEDRLRLQSLRSSAELQESRSAEASPDFLERLNAKITLEYSSSPDDRRAWELVNKTNQFNLNGRRYSEAEWQSYFQAPGAFLVTATYQDRFGPLGKIGVLGGRHEAGKLQVDIWVLSCRAFSRHIEFQMLDRLYEKFGASHIGFSFHPTDRNGPLQECFARFFPAGLGKGNVDLPAAVFEQQRPQLFHQVIESNHE